VPKKNQEHLNVPCFDPILSKGNTSATGQIGGKNPPAITGGEIPEDGSPNLQRSIIKYAYKCTEGSPIIQSRQTVLC